MFPICIQGTSELPLEWFLPLPDGDYVVKFPSLGNVKGPIKHARRQGPLQGGLRGLRNLHETPSKAYSVCLL